MKGAMTMKYDFDKAGGIPEEVSGEEIKENLEAMGTVICGRCYDEVSPEDLYPANCKEKPERLLGQPIGQYHCPDCGAMVLAGFPHPPLCIKCIERKHPGFDQMIKK
jgi:hypothetical protein